MTKRRINRGLAPAPSKVAKMKSLGYATAATLAKDFKVSLASVYAWSAGWRTAKVDGRDVVVKHGGNRWILIAAVKEKVDLPAGIGS